MKLLTQWAVTSSVLILIVLAVRVLFRDKLSARLKYALWGVVLLRLLAPFQVELPTAASAALPVLASNLVPEIGEARSIPVFPQSSRPVDEFNGITFDRLEPGEIMSTETSMGYYQRSRDGETITRYLDLWSPAQIVSAVWGAGAALMAVVLTASNLHFYSKLRKRRKKLEVPDAPVPVYVAEGLPSPCLFGVLRPAVYVTPQAAANPDTLRHVLAHELTHRAHFDHLWSLLRIAALALHWYNPLVWLAVVLSKRDGELACDEGAVARLGEEERIPYGRTLVDMVAARSLRPVDLLSCSTAMTGGGKSVKRRVAQLVQKPETVKTALFAAVSVMVLAAVFVFAGRAQPQPSTMFLSQLEQATAIRYIPTVYSSRSYPVPITDEELLAQAKDLLSTFTYLSEDEPYPDLSGLAPYQNPKIVLTCGEQEMEYTLMWQNNYTYLFPGDLWEQQEELVKEEGETAQLVSVSGTMRSQPGDRVFSTVSKLALLQMGNVKRPLVIPRDTPELEEEPIKLLATFSDNVYSQLAELARTNGSRYRVDAAEYPEALEELIQLFVNDEDFLSQNAQAKNTTPEDIAAWLKGEGSEPIPPEVLIVSRGTWTLSAFGDGSLLLMGLTIPDHLIVQIQNICQSYGVEISW